MQPGSAALVSNRQESLSRVQQSAGTNLWQRNAYLIPLERWGDHGFVIAEN